MSCGDKDLVGRYDVDGYDVVYTNAAHDVDGRFFKIEFKQRVFIRRRRDRFDQNAFAVPEFRSRGQIIFIPVKAGAHKSAVLIYHIGDVREYFFHIRAVKGIKPVAEHKGQKIAAMRDGVGNDFRR
jgi:hypothetical protein